MFHKIKDVKPLKKYELQVTFIDGTIKCCNIEPLFELWEEFESLRTMPGLFECVKVDTGGYGISWNDRIDLACDDLWENGRDLLKS